jgi:TDG/mug DNA glycosylase family protein
LCFLASDGAIIDLNKLKCFSPIENEKAFVLILGSMPGAESLRKGEYYANNRNLFWNIMGHLLGAGPERKYEDRLRILTDCGIALWDVLKYCDREGSLDSAIKDETIEVNDFPTFFKDHPHITQVFFNGTKAQTSYKRYVVPNLTGKQRTLKYECLPSTSPAHAAMSSNEKVERWRIIIGRIKTKGKT